MKRSSMAAQDRLASAKRDIEDNATTRGVIDVQRGLRVAREDLPR